MTDMPEPPTRVITAIRPQKRAGRVSVFIDDEFALGCRLEDVADLGWKMGARLSPGAIAQAREKLEVSAAKAAAEILLGYRARTEREMERRLARKGFSPPAVEAVLRRLRSEGYINDQAFAERFAETAPVRRFGRRRIQAELRKRGIESGLAEQAADSIDDETERELALEFARSRAQSMASLEPLARRRRLAGGLERRGFSGSTVRAVLDQVLNEGWEDPEDD